jgi:hypothetical protein
MRDKYVVIKAEDWEIYLADLLEKKLRKTVDDLETLPLKGDYFVIRDQDVFAPAGLWAYASNIHTAVDFTDTLGLSVMEEDTRASLLGLADELVTAADKWAHRDPKSIKIPD